MVDLGLELGNHENREQLLPADFVRDVAFRDGRADFACRRVLAKNPVAESEISAVDFLDGHLYDCIEQHRRAGRYAVNQRGYGGSLELHGTALDGDSCTLHAERNFDAS